jgi:TctA family transporter
VYEIQFFLFKNHKLPTMDEVLPVYKKFWTLLIVGGIVPSAVGLLPRIGPGRAVWIALCSRFAFKPNHALRYSEIKLL